MISIWEVNSLYITLKLFIFPHSLFIPCKTPFKRSRTGTSAVAFFSGSGSPEIFFITLAIKFILTKTSRKGIAKEGFFNFFLSECFLFIVPFNLVFNVVPNGS